MSSFFSGVAFGICLCLLAVFIIWIVYLDKSKRIKAQDLAFNKFVYTDSLWYKDPVEFNYKGHRVLVDVKQSFIDGTQRKCKLHKVYINNTACATVIKTNDTVNAYFAEYVDESFISDEVWDILKEAYLYSKNIGKETNKKSILQERNNESV